MNIDVFGLDKIVWKEGWVATSKDERALLEKELASKQEWVIEGVLSIARQSADYFLEAPYR